MRNSEENVYADQPVPADTFGGIPNRHTDQPLPSSTFDDIPTGDENQSLHKATFDDIPEHIQLDTRCGIGSCKPDNLQVCARIGVFVGTYSISALLTATLAVYINSQVSMLEKQFGFSSGETGLLMSCNDIGYLSTVIFAGYIARKIHIPRGLALGTMLYGICGILCAMPYFLQDPATFDLDTTPQQSVNTTFIGSRKKAPLCLNDTDDSNQMGCGESSGVGVSKLVADELGIKKIAFSLIAVGMVFQGVGKSIRSPFVTIYIDDAVDKRKTGYYMGIIIGIAIFGPALGFLLGGLFSRIYVTLESVAISPRDPRWIGAWWLGFAVFGACAMVFSIPLMCFPRYLKSKSRRQDLEMIVKTREIDAANSMQKKTTAETISHEIKEFGLTVWRLFRNVPYMILALSNVVNILGVAGVFAFMPKYIAAQYSIPLWQSNIILAVSAITSVSLGAFLGGIITRKFNMTPQTTVKMLLIFYVVHAVCVASGFFLGCKQPQLVGDNGKSEVSSLYERSASCVQDCACADEKYFPVCGDDGRSYFSPCHAGCSVATSTEFYNCTCLETGHATAGLCDQHCSVNLYTYAAFTFVGKLFTAFKIIPSFIAKIRAVEERDRAVASAVYGFMTSILGWMPGPVIFGLIIDDTCTLWKYTCGERQSCLLYDIEYFRKALHTFGAVASVIATLMLSTLYFYFRVKGQTEWSSTPRVQLKTSNGNDKTQGNNGQIYTPITKKE